MESNFNRHERVFIRGDFSEMLRQERAEHVLRRLQEMYPSPAIPLDHRDAYTLLVAVLLSAQCTDKMVNTVTPDLWALADNPLSMSLQDEARILEVIRKLGLAPKKAKAIKGLSKMLVEEYGGQVPDQMDQLEKLPGVGHKTASVVMAQAFNQPAFPVDTHIHRLAQRWGLTSGQNVAQTEADLKRLFPRESWNSLHLQIIYYGREHCTARGCDGRTCPLCRELYPKRKKPVLTRKA
jgi:endonuclease-3